VRQQLLIIFRRISREKGYFVINVLGLTAGTAAALLILLFVQTETQYDTFHPNHRSIYRVANDFQIYDQGETYAVSSAALGPALYSDYDYFESYLRIFYPGIFIKDLVLLANNQRIDNQAIYAVDSTFFDFFYTRFIQGNPENALASPFSVVLCKSMAEKYFGHTNIAGEKIFLKDTGTFTITAVVEDPPLNSHFHYQALFSIASLQEMDHFFENAFGPGVSWQTFEKEHFSFAVWTYLKTKDHFNVSDFLKNKWPLHVKKYHSNAPKGFSLNASFQPFRDIHLYSNHLYENTSGNAITRTINIEIIRAFLMVAVFLLLVSAINYTNFSISQFNKRKRSLGMSKILGGGSKDIFASFFLESFVTSLVALLLALFILELLLPLINMNLGLSLNLNLINNHQIIWVILSVFFFTALISGLFPALIFANAPLNKLLDKRNNPLGRSQVLKKILVSCQFSIALFMISTGLIVQSQHKHLKSMNWGFHSENIAIIELYDRGSKTDFKALDSILSDHPLVKNTAPTDYVFSKIPIRISSLYIMENDSMVCSFFTAQTSIDYLNLMGVYNDQISRERFEAGDAIVNQRLLDSLGIISASDTKIITHFQYLGGKLRKERRLAGFMNDFHYAFFNKPLEPLIFLPMSPERADYLAVQFHGNERNVQVKVLDDSWKAFNKTLPPDFMFLDDNIKEYFGHQNMLANFFGYFALVTVLIAFLGVFGITAYNITQRSVEISIRKTLGASLHNLFMIFIRYYIGLFVTGVTLGSILSIYLLQKWLNTFPIATSISWWHILLPALLVAATIISAISLHMVKVRKVEPAIALKQE
jgi:putative ABC transport system permease protein